MKLQDVEGSGQNSENKCKADDCLDAFCMGIDEIVNRNQAHEVTLTKVTIETRYLLLSSKLKLLWSP